MALSEKHRSSIYQTLSPMLGEEEAEALLSQFPASDLDRPATKEFVRAEMAGIRTDLAELRSELRGEVGGLETQISERFRQQTMWMAGAVVANMGATAALVALLG